MQRMNKQQTRMQEDEAGEGFEEDAPQVQRL
jgi:hypothetical protein